MCLVAAGCGTRLNQQQRALYAGRAAGGSTDAGSVAGQPQAIGGTGATGTVVTSGVNGASSATATGTGASGTGSTGGGSATQAGAPIGATATGKAACAAPSKEVGVTDTTITLGNVSQLSGVVPGFAQTAVDGVQAYINYVNSKGGVCGRQLKLDVADDGFESSQNASETQRLASQVLGFAGSFSVVDDGGVDAMRAAGTLDTGEATNPARQFMPNHFGFEPGPDPNKPYAAPQWKYLKAKGVGKVALVVVAVAASRTYAAIQRADLKAAGLQVALDTEVSSTQFSFDSTARAVADSGAQAMLFIDDLNTSAQMAQALAKVKNSVVYPWYISGYGPKFINLAGPASEGAVSFLSALPFEEAGSNAELDTYLSWLKRTAPSDQPDVDSISTWVDTSLFVKALAAVDGPITRPALIASMRKITSFDANGLISAMDPADKTSPGCAVVVRVTSGKWRVVAPASGFLC